MGGGGVQSLAIGSLNLLGGMMGGRLWGVKVGVGVEVCPWQLLHSCKCRLPSLALGLRPFMKGSAEESAPIASFLTRSTFLVTITSRKWHVLGAHRTKLNSACVLDTSIWKPKVVCVGGSSVVCGISWSGFLPPPQPPPSLLTSIHHPSQVSQFLQVPDNRHHRRGPADSPVLAHASWARTQPLVAPSSARVSVHAVAQITPAGCFTVRLPCPLCPPVTVPVHSTNARASWPSGAAGALRL